MSLSELENFYYDQPEPERSCFLVLREVILSLDDKLTPEWKYRLPFFYYQGKMFCYLWKDKVSREPYIGITDGLLIDHPSLEQGDRKRMKILRINPNKDIDVELVQEVLGMGLELRKKGHHLKWRKSK